MSDNWDSPGNLGGEFDASDVDPRQVFELLPVGWYTAMITASEMKATKACDGEYLNLTIQIVEGEYEGRLIWDLLNLNNPNEKAVDIARRTLSAICHATGEMRVRDSSELHDKPMRIKIGLKPAKDGYEASNKVAGYEAMDGHTPAAKAPPKPGAPAATPDKRAPWKR